MSGVYHDPDVDSNGAEEVNLRTSTGTELLGQTTMTGSVPVVLASNQTVIPVNDNNGSLTVDGTVTANIGTTNGLALDATLTGGTQKTKVIDSGGTNTLSISAAGAAKVDGSAVTQPVSGTVTATQGSANTVANAWPIKRTDGTNIASVNSDGSTNGNLAKVGGTAITLGQTILSASVPIAIASNQTNVPTTELGPTTTYTRISTNTTVTVKSGAGVLRRIIKSQGGNVTIYDNTAGSGTIIHTLSGTNPQGTIFYDIPFTTGLTIVTTSGPDIVVVYE